MLDRKTIDRYKQNKEIALLKNDIKLLKEINGEFTQNFKDQIYMVKELIQNFKVIDKIDLRFYKENIKNNKLSKTVQTYEEAIQLINTTNLFQHLSFDYKEKEFFKLNIPLQVKYIAYKLNSTEEEYENIISKLSKEYGLDNLYIKDLDDKHQIIEAYIIINSYAFINKEISGKYHIYIGNKDIDYNNYELKYSFIDIYCILFNLTNPKEAIIQLIEMLDITILDAQQLKKICKNNIDRIENISKTKYPNLFKLIHKHIYVLKEILNIAIRESNAKSINKVKCSQCYIAERVGRPPSTIRNYINGFAVLGFYAKEEIIEVTDDDKSVKNKITEYIIYGYTEETFVNAESIAKQLLDKGIALSKIEIKTIIECFGESMAKKVFKDKVARKKILNEDKICC